MCLQFIELKWVIHLKKLGIIGLVLIVLFFWQLIMIYRHVNVQAETLAAQSVKQAKKEFQIKTVQSVSEYRGEQSYEVINAILQNGVALWIFMPETKKVTVPITARVSDGYSKNAIIQAFKSHISYKRLISANLGLVNKTDPTWEITYIDPNGNYVFSYYDYYSGKSVLPSIALH